ncbi:MAG: hypothetical protein EBW02_01625, partial [Methylophilaceae bacterium]|nr:hypothetical protein [Methylophilaceae bacterium]
IVSIEGLDTRALVAHVRQSGAMNCIISSDNLDVDALKKQKERITTQIKNERDKQKKQSAIAKIANANQTLAKLRSS